MESSASGVPWRTLGFSPLHSSCSWEEWRLGVRKTRSPVRTRIWVGSRAWRPKRAGHSNLGKRPFRANNATAREAGVGAAPEDSRPPRARTPARCSPFRPQAPLAWCDTRPTPADARVAGSGRSASFCHLEP